MDDNVQWLNQENYGICIQVAVMSADNARSREAKFRG